MERNDMNAMILNDDELEQVSGGSSKASGNNFSYVIKRGDSLYSLAIRYGTTVEVLSRINGISNPSLIFAGSTILIPGRG